MPPQRSGPSPWPLGADQGVIPPLFLLWKDPGRSQTSPIPEVTGATRWAGAHELVRLIVAGAIGAGALLGVALVAPATLRGAAPVGAMAAVGVTAEGLCRFWDLGAGPGSSGNREGGGGTLGPS